MPDLEGVVLSRNRRKLLFFSHLRLCSVSLERVYFVSERRCKSATSWQRVRGMARTQFDCLAPCFCGGSSAYVIWALDWT